MIPHEQLDRIGQEDAPPPHAAAEEAAARAAVAHARGALREAEAAAALMRRRAALAGWVRARARAALLAGLVEAETRAAHEHVTNATLADDLQREWHEATLAGAITLVGIVLCVLAAATASIFWAPGLILAGVLIWLGRRCRALRSELRGIQRDLAASERHLIESGAQARLARRVAPSAGGALTEELRAAERALRAAGEPVPMTADEARVRLAELPAGEDEEGMLREALGQIERRRGHLEAALSRLAAIRRPHEQPRQPSLS
ncbi:MAG TPA: hypothetical protein VFY89_10570 [Ktedonobacterales bacterium]